MLGSIRAEDGSFWLFGYGSLIWRPDFPYVERGPARLHGWSRRFWQGSHDHRGVPDAPGRVATLVRSAGAVCAGMAYRVAPEASERVLASLDHREKNGYERHVVELELAPARRVPSLLYLAAPGNFAWLGPAPLAAIARQIATARGPSGANVDYLLELDRALAALGERDAHVEALVASIGEAPASSTGAAS